MASIEPLRRAVDRAAEGGMASDADAIARRLERLARDAGRFEVADSKGALRSLDVVRIDDAWLPEDLARAWLDALERTRDRVGRLDPTDVRRLTPVLDRLERETGALLGTPSEEALRARLEEILGL